MAVGGTLGSAVVTKVALVAVLAGGGVVASEAAIERANGPNTAAPAAAHHKSDGAAQGRAGRGERVDARLASAGSA